MSNRCAVVWNEAVLSYELASDHPLHPVRLDLTMRLADALGVLDGVDLVPPKSASREDLLRVHVEDYLAAVEAAPEALEAGHGLGTPDNPVFANMHEASSLVVGASITAAEQIVSGRVKRAVNIAGGLHHAMADHAAGFCVYNDAAASIAWMLERGVERVAYLDIDVHHGDGVQHAFQDDPRVLTISVHQHPHTLWPGTGHATEVGVEPADGSAVNIALPPGTGDADWHRALHAVVPSLLAGFAPDVLVTQCGADGHRDDPLADLMLTVDGQRAAYRTLRDFAERFADGRWLALGGGGYSLFRVVPRAWTHLLATALDRDLAPDTRIPQEWRAHVNELVGDVTLPLSMSDGQVVEFAPWTGVVESAVDAAIRDTRHAVFPLHGLDPVDCRD